MKGIPFVAVTESVHVARWISRLRDQSRPCFVFDDGASPRESMPSTGGQQQNPEVGGLFCPRREEGAGPLPYSEAIHRRFARSIYRAAARAAKANGGTGRGTIWHCPWPAAAMAGVVSRVARHFLTAA